MSAAYRSAEDVPVPRGRALSIARGRLLVAASVCATALLWMLPVLALFLGGLRSDELRAATTFASFAFAIGAATGYLRARKRVTAGITFVAWNVAVLVIWIVEEPVKVDPLLVATVLSVIVGRGLGLVVRRLNEVADWHRLVERRSRVPVTQTVPFLRVNRESRTLEALPDSKRTLVARVRVRRSRG